MTNFNVLLVVLVVWLVVQVVQIVVLVVQDLAELEGVKVLEYLVLAVLLLPYFICFNFTILGMLYFVLLSFCVYNISLNHIFIVLLHSLLLYLLFSPYSYLFYFVNYL